MRKVLILVLAILGLSPVALFASDFSLYLTGGYLWSYDTNVFSEPMVKYSKSGSAWEKIRTVDPYIKRFNNGFSLTGDMFFSETARTGLSLSAHVGLAYKATEYKPNTDDITNNDWDYVARDVLDEQKIAMFFGIGPAFRVILGNFDIGLSLRASLGSYDYFDNNIILGLQADPFVNFFISSKLYVSAGLHYDAHFLYLYINSPDNHVYLPNYIRLTAGGYVGVGYKFGLGRSTNV